MVALLQRSMYASSDVNIVKIMFFELEGCGFESGLGTQKKQRMYDVYFI